MQCPICQEEIINDFKPHPNNPDLDYADCQCTARIAIKNNELEGYALSLKYNGDIFTMHFIMDMCGTPEFSIYSRKLHRQILAIDCLPNINSQNALDRLKKYLIFL